jgi:hypothetical protein
LAQKEILSDEDKQAERCKRCDKFGCFFDFCYVHNRLKLNFYLDRKITLLFILVNNILLIILLTGGFGGVILLSIVKGV